jgi:hypothetical protein
MAGRQAARHLLTIMSGRKANALVTPSPPRAGLGLPVTAPMIPSHFRGGHASSTSQAWLSIKIRLAIFKISLAIYFCGLVVQLAGQLR